jgi:hypothetical protein
MPRWKSESGLGLKVKQWRFEKGFQGKKKSDRFHDFKSLESNGKESETSHISNMGFRPISIRGVRR